MDAFQLVFGQAVQRAALALAAADQSRDDGVCGAERQPTAGEVVGETDIDFRRPGTGIRPTQTSLIVGMVAARDIPADTPLRFEDVRPA